MSVSPPNKTSTHSGYHYRTQGEKITFAFLCAVLIALVIGLNSLIISAYRKNRKLRTATNLLFVYLAASDLLVGAISIPLWALHEYIGAVELTSESRVVYYFFDMFSALASIIFLTAISVERNLAISKPIYHRACALRYYHVTGFVIGFYAMALSVIFVQELGQVWLKWRGLVTFLFGFFLPLCLIVVMYINIWRNIKKFESRHQSPSFNKRALQRERRAVCTVAIVIGLFVVAWLPFFVFSVLYVLCGHPCMPTGKHAFHAVDLVKFLHYSNSAINPFVYGYRNADIRRTVCGILTCRQPRRMEGHAQRRLQPRNDAVKDAPILAHRNGLVHNVAATPL